MLEAVTVAILCVGITISIISLIVSFIDAE